MNVKKFFLLYIVIFSLSLPIFSQGNSSRYDELLREAGKQYASQNYEKSIEIFTAMISDFPHDATVRIARAMVFIKTREFDRAIDDCNEAVKTEPQSMLLALLTRGDAYLEQEKFSESINDYNYVLAFNPKETHALNQRGYAYLMLGKHKEAVEDFSKAIPLQIAAGKSPYETYKNRGFSYYMLGKKSESRSDFEKALRYAANDAERQEIQKYIGMLES